MKKQVARFGFRIAAAFAVTSVLTIAAWPQARCPLSYGSVDNSKSVKLYLYFPTVNDNTFPSHDTSVSPAKPFNVSDLSSSIGTTAQLRDRIHDVVVDDYCEFNVQVLQTTTNPKTLSSPPSRYVTVAVGSDSNVVSCGPSCTNSTWGEAQEVYTGDKINVDFARIWAGTYGSCAGTEANGNCSTGSLTVANNTLDRWAQAIGGASAHEAGHTFGLAHSDDNPPTDTNDPGPNPLPGEDAFSRHLMPSGNNLTGENRASYRRHVSDRGFGLLATNVGLSIQTMWNWDLINPNGDDACGLTMDFLSTKTSITPAAAQEARHHDRKQTSITLTAAAKRRKPGIQGPRPGSPIA